MHAQLRARAGWTATRVAPAGSSGSHTSTRWQTPGPGRQRRHILRLGTGHGAVLPLRLHLGGSHTVVRPARRIGAVLRHARSRASTDVQRRFFRRDKNSLASEQPEDATEPDVAASEATRPSWTRPEHENRQAARSAVPAPEVSASGHRSSVMAERCFVTTSTCGWPVAPTAPPGFWAASSPVVPVPPGEQVATSPVRAPDRSATGHRATKGPVTPRSARRLGTLGVRSAEE